ncbi:hypothetical protein QRK73_002594 [Enterococcus faecalis]|nr:hypothetical protein [Enterococcus faecalis]
MSKKAVWLSDIEFIEMHSSDWERLESEAFEPDESVQAQLNPNQQIVLDWLKDEYCDGNPFFTIWHTLEDRYFKGSSDALLASQQIEILQAFSQWALEQEEAE